MTGSRYSVLLYHGVHGDDVVLGHRNSSGKHISRSRFERQMAHIASRFPVVSMRQVADAIAGNGDIHENAVAITFDDGFLNNYTEAWPILEKYRIPATIYLATGYIGTGRMVWSDRLEAMILGAARPRIAIDVFGSLRHYDLRTEGQKVAAFSTIKDLCKTLPDSVKNDVLGQVANHLGEPNPDHPLYAFLNWDQVRRMDRSPLVDFGAHTVDHVSLAKVPQDIMKRQIDDSIACLERELGHKCGFFSYPEGQAGDYDADVVRYLRSRGFDHCPSAIDGTNSIGSVGPFDIRRIMVGFQGRPYPFADL